MTLSSNFLITFCFYCQVTGPSFMSILSLVPDLWQFSSIRDWPEIQKLEIPPLDFCPLSGDWGELEISSLPRMCLMKCYWVLAKYQGYSFYCFWVGKIPLPSPSRLGLKMWMAVNVEISIVVWSWYTGWFLGFLFIYICIWTKR